MEVNGRLNVMGGGEPPVISGVAAATVGGEDSENKKGVLKFNNGFKIQWDTVDVVDDVATDFDLPEAYTEAHYNVIGCYAEAIGGAVSASSCHLHVAAAPNELSKVNIYQIHSATALTQVTFISWGKDL